MELTKSNGWRGTSKSSQGLLLKASTYGRRRRAREYIGIVLEGSAGYTTLFEATLIIVGCGCGRAGEIIVEDSGSGALIPP